MQPASIDAEGLAVAPGFIDIKTHSDFTLPINPKAESKVRQGVTTEIIGHCGFSVAPVLPGKVELIRDYLSPSAPWLPFRETTFSNYLDTFPATAVNAGMLVGHNTLRLMAMGMAERAPSAAELAQMIALLEEALEAGALGLSSGLFTSPGSYAEPAELIALCHVRQASQWRLLHPPARRVGQRARCGCRSHRDRRGLRVHVEIVHFKCSGTDNWGKASRALDMIAGAKARGARCRLRFLSVYRRQQPAEKPAAAMGAGRRRRRPCSNDLPPPTRARVSAPTSTATASTTGAASVMGLRADFDIAAPAAVRRPHHRGACRRTRPGPDRHAVRLPDR